MSSEGEFHERNARDIYLHGLRVHEQEAPKVGSGGGVPLATPRTPPELRQARHGNRGVRHAPIPDKRASRAYPLGAAGDRKDK